MPVPLDIEAAPVALVPSVDARATGPLIFDVRKRILYRLTGVLPFVFGHRGDSVLVRALEPDSSAWGAIDVFDVTTGNARVILPPVSLNIQLLGWPEPDRLFVSLDGQPAQVANRPVPWPSGTYEIDVDHATATRIDTQFGASVSNDGTLLLSPLAGRTRYRVVDTRTGASRSLEDLMPVGVAIGSGPPVWSPVDGRVAAETSTGRVAIFDLAAGATGAGATYLEPGPAARGLAWSPDGRFLAVRRGTDDPETWTTWIIDTTGSGPPRGPYDDVTPASWRPDGGALLVVAGACQPDGWWLETVSPDTSAAPLPIPTVLHGWWFQSWSPDGASVVAGDVRQGIFLIDVATGSSKRLDAFGSGFDVPFPSGLAWTPDGNYLFGSVDAGRDRCGN